jgi:hypothetical protein
VSRAIFDAVAPTPAAPRVLVQVALAAAEPARRHIAAESVLDG